MNHGRVRTHNIQRSKAYRCKSENTKPCSYAELVDNWQTRQDSRPIQAVGSKDRHGNVAFIQNLKVSFSMAKLHCFNSVWLVLSPGCIGVGHSHQEHKGQGGNPLPAALAAVNWAGNKPATATISRAVGSVFLQPDSCLGSARCSCWRTAHVPGPHLCCLINNRIHTCTRR